MKKLDFLRYKKDGVLHKILTLLAKSYKEMPVKNFLAVFIASIMLFASVYYSCQFFLEPGAYNFLVWLSSNKKASDQIVIVDIDNNSISQIGRWPWKRAYYADIFEYLEKDGKAQLVVFDSLIRSKDNNKDDNEFFNRIKKLNKVVFSVFFSKQADNYENQNDENSEKLLKNQFSLKIDDTRSQKLIKKTEYSGSSYVLYDLLKSAKNLGSVMVYPDKDGIIRKYEPVIYFKNSYYPSLSLEVFSKLSKDSKFVLNNKWLESDKFKMPIYNSSHGAYTYIKWYKPFSKAELYSHKSYSAWKVIKSYEQIKNGQKPILSPDIFKDKIVVIGATATALNDIKSTPLGSNYSGVDIQATCIDNILNNDFIHKPSPVIRFIILFGVTVITLLAILLLQPLYSTIFILLLLVGYFNICAFIAYPNNFALDITVPLAFIFCSFTVGYGYKYILENSKKRQIQKIMAKYISKDVMTNVLNNIEDVKLGGKRAEVTVLFADIRGFTSISESLDPEQVSAILNLYFSEMIPIILKHNGMLNKFMGDALLAVFGAPIENSEHPIMAVKCAIEMLEKVKELQQKWLEENNTLIEIGIAISTGEVFLGNIGSEDRLEYTVIGDTVNIASRIEALNKLFNTKLLISQTTFEKVEKIKNLDYIKIKSVPIRGKSEPIDIYEIIKFID
ncbi:MAG: adenylate/guanylate cyclase domain-containing protein [Candidatus Gastranaerophilales bacterium]|nr:adenylate/guanylate cyclase domain-containing protein [Candidatus Gastranaerophilales bacterium]